MGQDTENEIENMSGNIRRLYEKVEKNASIEHGILDRFTEFARFGILGSAGAIVAEVSVIGSNIANLGALGGWSRTLLLLAFTLFSVSLFAAVIMFVQILVLQGLLKGVETTASGIKISMREINRLADVSAKAKRLRGLRDDVDGLKGSRDQYVSGLVGLGRVNGVFQFSFLVGLLVALVIVGLLLFA